MLNSLFKKGGDGKGSDYVGNSGINTTGMSTSSVSTREPTSGISIGALDSLAEEIATLYAEGETQRAIEIISKHINANKGRVDKRFWFMLMDIHQATNNKEGFEKAAILFANTFGTSPPSWSENTKDEKQVVAGKNIIILDGPISITLNDKLKEFVKAAKVEKYCRIDVSKTKLEISELAGLDLLLRTMGELRKFRVLSVLMGENHLTQFTKQYVNPNKENKSLNQAFFDNESLFWLLQLEILQWKGRSEEFETMALDYAMKFEMSPPGWDEKGVMKVEEKARSIDTSHQVGPVIEKIINSNNVDKLCEILTEEIEKKEKPEISFKEVERVDFAAAGAITFHLQEMQQKSPNKILFKDLNECILVLLEMVGATEFIEVAKKDR